MQRPPTGGSKKTGGGGDLAKLLSTRGGLVGVAIFAALLAGALLLVFLQQYKKNLTADDARTVLVAKTMIPKGSSGDVIASEGMFQVTKAQGDDVKDGAVTDPAALHGKTSSTSIYPGQQLTAGEFATGSNAANTKLVNDQRAIALPVDKAHGMIGEVAVGDHVDVYGSFDGQSASGRISSQVRVLLRDAVVLRVPEQSKNGTNATQQQPIVVRSPDAVTPGLAYSADNGKIWIVERPQAGAKDSHLDAASIQNVLSGKPIATGTGGSR